MRLRDSLENAVRCADDEICADNRAAALCLVVNQQQHLVGVMADVCWAFPDYQRLGRPLREVGIMPRCQAWEKAELLGILRFFSCESGDFLLIKTSQKSKVNKNWEKSFKKFGKKC